MAKDRCCIKKCRVEGRLIRGLCSRCYQTALGIVRKGTVTWEQLISLGMAKNSSGRRSVNGSLFSQELESKLKRGK